jgi:hypothetical protein
MNTYRDCMQDIFTCRIHISIFHNYLDALEKFYIYTNIHPDKQERFDNDFQYIL